ncbi:hypothetical protein B0T14DRAFT_606969 [Immersiella caudata]|uniref:Clr5 domain-containing protein n=1 Tax=Immersiella caudata TaxID=314043 RepID=A0AA39TKM8_9PEZI|nr:hypothetical protein B0T14DRAFT_606969 [Immersiella caudata]
MAAPGRSFQFVNAPVAPRTERIPPEVWEKHKAEATKIYLESNVGEVAVQMQLRHNFQASPRQYIYQFKKWGIKKQGAGNIPTAVWSTSPGSASPLELGPGHTTKRRRNVANDRNSTSSAGPSLPEPPKKKHEREQGRSFSTAATAGFGYDVTAHHEAATARQGHDHETFENLELPPDRQSPAGCAAERSVLDEEAAGEGIKEPPLQTANIRFESIDTIVDCSDPSDNTDKSPTSTTSASSSSATTVSTVPPAEAASPAGSSAHPGNSVSTAEKEQLLESIRSLLVKRYEAIPRIIDRARPVDTFSGTEVADVSLAADFFAALNCNHEAFELYITALKRRSLEIKNKKSCGFRLRYILLQCASTVSSSEHAGVVRNILELELHKAEHGQPGRGSPSTILAFLLHMVLVLVCHRSGDPDGARRHVIEARPHVPADNLFGHGSDGALDLALYLSVLRWRAAELGSLTRSPSRLFGLEPERMASLEDYVLSHVPGPFQIQGNKSLVNPCIRSCLTWCNEKILRLRLLPAQDRPRGPHERIMFDDSQMLWNESETLFIMLWQQWHPNLHSDNAPVWVLDSQNTTGITPTEMLMVVARMICADCMGFCDSPMINGYDEWKVSLQGSAMDLLGASDMELGRMFLREYVSQNTIASSLDLYHKTRLRRHKATKLMEETLRVTFGNIDIPSADLRRSTLQLYSSVFVSSGENQHPSPTLASSLSSPDWSDFKRTGESAAQRLIRFARGSPPVPSVSPPFLSLSPPIPSLSPRVPSARSLRTTGTPDSMAMSITASLKALSISSGSPDMHSRLP